MFLRSRHRVTLAGNDPVEGRGITKRRRAGLENISIAADHEGDLRKTGNGASQEAMPAQSQADAGILNRIEGSDQEVEEVTFLVPKEP